MAEEWIAFRVRGLGRLVDQIANHRGDAPPAAGTLLQKPVLAVRDVLLKLTVLHASIIPSCWRNRWSTRYRGRRHWGKHNAVHLVLTQRSSPLPAPAEPHWVMPLSLRDSATSRGNLGIMDMRILAIFSSSRCPGDLILRTYDFIRAIDDPNLAIAGGLGVE